MSIRFIYLLSGVLVAGGESAAACRRTNYAAGACVGKGCLIALGSRLSCLLRSTAKIGQKPKLK